MEFLINYGPFAAVALLALLDRIAPARRFPEMRGWRSRGLGYFVAYVAIATALPLTVDSWLGPYRLVDATGLGLVAGTLVGILALELGSYWWHRALHRVPFLWRWFHQMHHSAERVDIYGAFIFHPLDTAAFTLVGSLCLVLFVGVSPLAAGLANVIVFFAVVLGHANLRTPPWLGYIVQRPENHALHHERGVHAYNYADLSFIDMIFGTFRNPQTWEEEAGFFDGASEQVGAMLLGRDISSDVTPADDAEAPDTLPSEPVPSSLGGPPLAA
jgi:sterol desaturase/sphingolipid hydroxylase (fatty acid hydroxylase superfamily)